MSGKQMEGDNKERRKKARLRAGNGAAVQQHLPGDGRPRPGGSSR